jgi:hypothetical protein
MFGDPPGQGGRKSPFAGDSFGARGFEFFHRSEGQEQLFLSGGAYARDIQKSRVGQGFLPKLSVVGNGKPVGLVPDPHQQVRCRPVRGKNQGGVELGRDESLEVTSAASLLGDSHDLFGEWRFADLVEGGQCGPELRLSAVDEKKVGQGALVEMTGENLGQHPKVVLPPVVPDPKSSVERLFRETIDKDDQGGDRKGISGIRDVHAANAGGSLFKTKHLANLFEGLPKIGLTLSAFFQGGPGIVLREFDHGLLFSSPGVGNDDLSTFLFGHPLEVHEGFMGQGMGEKDLLRKCRCLLGVMLFEKGHEKVVRAVLVEVSDMDLPSPGDTSVSDREEFDLRGAFVCLDSDGIHRGRNPKFDGLTLKDGPNALESVLGLGRFFEL